MVARRTASTWRHLQHPADGLDTKLLSINDIIHVRVNEHDYILCRRSSSAPKKLAARVRISLALGSNTCFHTVVTVCRPLPRLNRLNSVTQLQCDPLSGSPISYEFRPQGPHHPNRGSFLLRRLPPPSFPVLVHDSILVSKV